MTEVVLTVKQAEALRRVRDRGPKGWCHGLGRAGGAVARLFDRLHAAGLVSRPPYVPTEQGLRALDAYDASLRKKEDAPQPRVAIELAAGQIWREVDDRFQRYVRIENVQAGRRGISIRTVEKADLGWQAAPRSRLSYADHNRFNGKNGGYEFAEAATDSAVALHP